MHDAASNVLGREAREKAVLKKEKVVHIHVRLIMVSDERLAFGFFLKKRKKVKSKNVSSSFGVVRSGYCALVITGAGKSKIV